MTTPQQNPDPKYKPNDSVYITENGTKYRGVILSVNFMMFVDHIYHDYSIKFENGDTGDFLETEIRATDGGVMIIPGNGTVH